MPKISIVGATTWGTTLAIVNAIGNKENEIFHLTRSQAETTKLENENQNSKFLPGYSFPNNINIKNSKSEALENTDLVILAGPSITFRENLTNIKDFISSNKGEIVLIVGHSNTIPNFFNELINDQVYAQIDDLNNSNLYIVSLCDSSISHRLIKVN